ncbi:DUF1680 family protein [Terrimicrobium sacchariphilum]|uniref:DUF1680 family protein n=1 Tax=Terrimicrobium sacchariphilum TaxID=690879 RepID=A0A146G199_TERSA|nr:beta-L-arabinofuranosidase domain-containing protein [Terrimicrobium sacchariphilum]GAT31481.1 DUF1680 family protein [Terrimicrobium sacchariphilum]
MIPPRTNPGLLRNPAIWLALPAAVFLVLPALCDPHRTEYVKAPVFTPLPLGAVKPTGWMKDWCQEAVNGIPGHADQLDPAFEKGWLDASIKANSQGMQPGDRPNGYALEQAGYWLDGATRLAHLLGDKELLAKCRLRYDAILKRVEATGVPMDGSPAMWNEGEKWAHWPMAVVGRALLAEYSATDDPRYLHAIEKIYADYARFNAATNDKGKTFSLIAHPGRQPNNAEIMLEAYRLGGRSELRDDALAIIRAQESEIDERLAWHEEGLATGKTDRRFYGVKYGHAVTFNESTKIPAIGYQYSGDDRWLKFSEASYDDMEQNEMLPYGLTSAHEQLGGIGPFSTTEMCNAIDYMWSSLWLLRITGKPTYGDRIERDFFNAGPGGIAPDFHRHVYFLSPNRIDAEHPKKMSVGGSPDYAPKQFPLCCTGNIARLLPNYIMHQWMTTDDQGLAAVLYGPNTVTTIVRGAEVSITSRTDYPFSDKISLEITPRSPVEFPLYLRVPAWCENPRLEINGKTVAVTVDKGFLKVSRHWAAGDVVNLQLPSQPKVHVGQCANGAPFSFATYGPLLFALNIPTRDGDLNQPAPGFDFQYALIPGAVPEVTHRPMPSPWTWATPPLSLRVKAIPAPFGKDFSLPAQPVAIGESKIQDIELIPFGSTAFRVSMFRVAGGGVKK